MSILSKQAALVREFSQVQDWEERYKRIIELGRGLPPLDEAQRTEANKVRGCSSNVWLVAELRDGRVHYAADSDALIVRGLVQLLLRVFSAERPGEIVTASPEFIAELGLDRHLSQTRANGLHAMVKQIKAYALAFQAVSARVENGTSGRTADC